MNTCDTQQVITVCLIKYLIPGGVLSYVSLTGTCGAIGYGLRGVLS